MQIGPQKNGLGGFCLRQRLAELEFLPQVTCLAPPTTSSRYGSHYKFDPHCCRITYSGRILCGPRRGDVREEVGCIAVCSESTEFRTRFRMMSSSTAQSRIQCSQAAPKVHRRTGMRCNDHHPAPSRDSHQSLSLSVPSPSSSDQVQSLEHS